MTPPTFAPAFVNATLSVAPEISDDTEPTVNLRRGDHLESLSPDEAAMLIALLAQALRAISPNCDRLIQAGFECAAIRTRPRPN
jgi:hypothetical protein